MKPKIVLFMLLVQLNRLLTPGVYNTAVQKMGGYARRWDALYYRRFVQDEREDRYFEKWLSLWEDSRMATPGSEARIGNEWFANWEYVQKLSDQKLNSAVDAIRTRCSNENWIYDVYERPEKPPSSPSRLVELVKAR